MFDLVLGKFLQFSLRSKHFSFRVTTSIKSCQTRLVPPTLLRKEWGRCVLQNDIFFIKIQKVHRVIKGVVSFLFLIFIRIKEKNGIGDIFKSYQTKLSPLTLVREGCVLESGIFFFIKVQKGHRLIKSVVRIFFWL